MKSSDCCCAKAFYGQVPCLGSGSEGLDPCAANDYHDLMARVKRKKEKALQEHDDVKVREKAAAYAERKVADLKESSPIFRTPMETEMIAPFRWKEIKLGRKLGTGGFSDVYEIASFSLRKSGHYTKTAETARKLVSEQHEVTCRVLHSGSPFVLKQLRSKCEEDSRKFLSAAADLACEAQIMFALDHPNIVKIRGYTAGGPSAFKDDDSNGYFIVMDRLTTNLQVRIHEWREKFEKYKKQNPLLKRIAPKKSEKQFKSLMLERLKVAHSIASAIEYMHKNGVINRDIKTANIGFDLHDDVKVYDLGLARCLTSETADDTGLYDLRCVGTEYYQAPEVERSEMYNTKADVYSFGVVLWEILSLSSPKYAKKEDGDSFPICPCWPSSIQELVRLVLSEDMSLRPSMRAVRRTLHKQIMEMMYDKVEKEKTASKSKAKEGSTQLFDCTSTGNSSITAA